MVHRLVCRHRAASVAALGLRDRRSRQDCHSLWAALAAGRGHRQTTLKNGVRLWQMKLALTGAGLVLELDLEGCFRRRGMSPRAESPVPRGTSRREESLLAAVRHASVPQIIYCGY